MYCVHITTNKPHDAVIVTATDYNGHRGCQTEPNHLPLVCGAWDGVPFRNDRKEIEPSTISWFMKAMLDKQLIDHNRGGSDYAQWDLMIDGKLEKTAQPGDYITYDGDRCFVFTGLEFAAQFRKAN